MLLLIFLLPALLMSAAYSIPQAKRQQKLPQFPGPGQYNPENSPTVSKKQDPQYSIGKERRDSPTRNEVPGPGSYNTHEIKTHMHSQPSYSIATKVKQYEECSIVGPGTYMVRYDVEKEKAPAYTIMRSKVRSSLDSITPGPGNYEPFKSSSVIENRGGPKFGHSKRQYKLRIDTPGPGAYQQDHSFDRYASKHEPQYGFTTAKNTDLNKLEVPGPGYYNTSNNNLSKIGGIMSREIRSSLKNMQVPGPGTYNIKNQGILENSPKYTLPRSLRARRPQSQLPGPGYYQEPRSFQKVRQKSPKWKFTQQQRHKQRGLETPGPGKYETTPKKSRVEGPHIGVRLKQHQQNPVPGPGSYSVKYEFSNSRPYMYSVGRGQRIINKAENIPGPGAYRYDNLLPKTQGPTFTTQKRLKQSKFIVPGPGQYDIKPMFADVPKYLLSKN